MPQISPSHHPLLQDSKTLGHWGSLSGRQTAPHIPAHTNQYVTRVKVTSILLIHRSQAHPPAGFGAAPYPRQQLALIVAFHVTAVEQCRLSIQHIVWEGRETRRDRQEKKRK